MELLDEFVGLCRKVLGEGLTGVYLHGSMAMGCFNPDKSDIDLIAVTEEGIGDEQKMSLMEGIVALNGRGPVKGLEISFVRREYCRPFVYPTPFELHFSPAHLQWFRDDPQGYVEKMKGEDRDLAAHFTIINACGVRLYGGEIADVFGAVPREDYLDSIWYDVENAGEEIAEDPIYMILNLCRVLAYLKDGSIFSKQKGGEWGLAYLDERYRPLIAQALECYRSDQAMQAEENTARQFAEYMLEGIRSFWANVK